MTVINYSGRASELGGIIDFVDQRRSTVYHALSVHLSRAKLTARSTIDAVAKFSKSGVYGKVPEGITLIFVDR